MSPLTARGSVDRAVGVMPTLGLEEVQADADLQTRTDRKYLVPAADFLAMTRRLDGALAVLEIDLIFTAIADAMPGLKLAGDPRRLRSAWINGVKELPVTTA